MIHSMTGYGKADAEYNGKKIHVEIKSLNSKNLDLNTRIATAYREKEMELRKLIAAELLRGKIDFTLWCEKATESAGCTINAGIVADYVPQIQTISGQVSGLADEEWNVVADAVRRAIKALQDFRLQEGEALTQKFMHNIDRIETLFQSIEPFEQSRVEKIRTRLEERLAELTGLDYDKNRLEQELIYYIEKLDINEEKQRLTNHLHYFRETLAGAIGQGKKLGFIAQEMGREINTTGSKSNQAEMQNIVVMMKDELEQIKEQVLNVL